MTPLEIENNSIFNTYCDALNFKNFNLDTIDNMFIISKTKDGKILSRFKDSIWDFSPYAPIHLTYKIDFKKNLDDSFFFITEAKKLTFIALVFGKGKRASSMSISSLLNLFHGFIVPFVSFSKQHSCFPKEIFENDNLLLHYSSTIQNSVTKIRDFCTFLKILSKTNNTFTNIKYKIDKNFIKALNLKEQHYSSQYKQTLIIPSRILYYATKQRWFHIDAIEKYIDNIALFLMRCLENKSFAIADSSKNKIKIKNQTIIFWSDAVNKYKLDNFFSIYRITDRKSYFKFIHSFKITCKHLVHTYTGMRRGEVFSLKNNCFRTENNSSIIVGTTTKLEIASKEVKWVTSKEIERVIVLLNKLNITTADSYGLGFNSLPLFCSNIILPSIIDKMKNHGYQSVLYNGKELYLDTQEIQITQNDIDEIEEINFNQLSHEINIGSIWNFTTHQYRRSLVVYAIQSDIVSLGALQHQLKHLFKEMTLYYGNGASYAKKLFNLPQEHIAAEFDKTKPELETLSYIKNVIFSDEHLFGAHGTFVENTIKQSNPEFKTYFLQNRDKTLKQFNNGAIAYQETALGGCISTKACYKRLTRTITACLDCHASIIKKSKLNNVIEQQKEFLSNLNPHSIEYNTECEDLLILENFKIQLERKETV